MNLNLKILGATALLTAGILSSGCNDSKSYAELLTEENQAINAYLLNQKVETTLPDDGNFLTGEDAPFYKLDEEGNVYMKVIDAGNPEWMAESDELIYFRFTRWSLLSYNPYTNEHIDGWGNSDDLGLGSASFRFGNYTLSSSSAWGSGLQMPLNYIGLERMLSNCKIAVRTHVGDFQRDPLPLSYPLLQARRNRSRRRNIRRHHRPVTLPTTLQPNQSIHNEIFECRL